jgi:PAS domain S-box-containing protein
MIPIFLTINLVILAIIVFMGARFFELKRAKMTLQRLMDQTHTGYCKYRYKDGVVIEANRGLIDILELDMGTDEAVGRSMSELVIYIDDEDKIRKRIKTEGVLRNYEYHFKTLKGKDKWVLYNACMIKDPRTGEEAIEALIKDITDTRAPYGEMREAEERYRKLFKNSGDMVIIYKFDDGSIEETNPVTDVLTGFSAEELAGKPFAELLHPSSRNQLKESHKDLMFRGHARLEGIIVCKNGPYKEVSLTLSMFEIRDNKIVMAIIKDMSGLIRDREEQVRRKEDLEEFWKASIEREERLKGLRTELQVAKQQIKILKGKDAVGRSKKEK